MLFMTAAITAFVNPADDTDDQVALQLAFMTHLDMELPEQDVFIERVPGSGEVFRVTTGDHNMNAPLYKSVKEIRHNPFSAEAIGPYEKGEPLGMTLGEWLKQTGTGRLHVRSRRWDSRSQFYESGTQWRIHHVARFHGHASS